MFNVDYCVGVFQHEMSDLMSGSLGSTMVLQQSWVAFQHSWYQTGNCVLQSMYPQHDEKNYTLMHLASSVDGVAVLTAELKERIAEPTTLPLVCILCTVLGYQFLHVLQSQQFFLVLKKRDSELGHELGFKLLIAYVKHSQMATLEPLQIDPAFRAYVTSINDTAVMVNMQFPQASEFDRRTAELMSALQQATFDYQQQKSNTLFIKSQKEKYSAQLQQIEQTILTELEQRLYNVALKAFNNLLNMYLNKDRLSKLNKNTQNTVNLKETKCMVDLDSREAFLIEESVTVPECQNVEYKHFQQPLDDKREFIIKKVVTSFLNSKGGNLYIGIADDLLVKGFHLGGLKEQELFDKLQDVINTIHPSPKYGSQYGIFIYPIYSQNGEILQHKRIIKIEVKDVHPKPNVYSFQQYVQEYGCQMICSFFRLNDSSRFLSHQAMKEKILMRSNHEDTRGRRFSGRQKTPQRNRTQAPQRSPFPRKSPNIIPRKHRSPIPQQPPKQPSPPPAELDQVDNSLILYIEEPAQPPPPEETDRQRCLILRKFANHSLPHIQPVVKQLAEQLQANVKMIQSTLVMNFKSRADLQSMRQQLTRAMRELASQSRVQIGFTMGEPTDLLDVVKWKPDMTSSDVLEMQESISNVTKLFNFKLSCRQSKCSIRAERLSDQITIYENMKGVLSIYWKLINKEEIRLNL